MVKMVYYRNISILDIVSKHRFNDKAIIQMKIFKLTEEHRKKISEANKGQIPWIKGKHHTEEVRKKLSESHKGLRPWRKGIKLSEEHKIKLSKINKGRKFPKEHGEKISKAKKGQKYPPRSEETKRKMSESKKGEKCRWWKGGITPINAAIRSSLEYRLWREAVFKRDNWTCIWCGARSGNGKTIILNVDHIKAFAYFPELRFAIDNGRTLCVSCHKKTDTYAGKISKKIIYENN